MKKVIFIAILFVVLIAGIFTLRPTATAQPTLPETAHVSGVIGHAQTYNLSCESRSAADLAAYWGVNISETTFFSQLPTSDNPDKGFVGNVHGQWGQTPPYSYGVHAAPVANLMRDYGLNAAAYKGLTWYSLRSEVAAGRPPIVWLISTGLPGVSQSYTAQDGTTTVVAAQEHTNILIGYNANYVHLIDAYTGQTIIRDIPAFLNSWAVLGNMAVYVNGHTNMSVAPSAIEPTVPPVRPPATTTNTQTYTVQWGDTLASIARNFGLSWQELAQINGIGYPYYVYAGQTLTLKPTNQQTNEPTIQPSNQLYIVQSGDTLGLIAQHHNLNWIDLATLNAIPYPYYVYAGQTLRLR